MGQEGGEIRIVGLVVDNEACVHRGGPAADVGRIRRIGVTTQAAVRLEQHDIMSARQEPGR